MLSAAAAKQLLAQATRLERLGAIARELGFDARAEELSPALRSRFSIPPGIARARISRGPGALRAFLLEFREEPTTRAVLADLASNIARTAPHSLWLALGCVARGSSTFIAVWETDPTHRPRIKSLLVDRNHIYASDVETLCSLAATAEGADVLVHSRWSEILGRDSLTRRFYSGLRTSVQRLADDLSGSLPRTTRAELALLNASRLLFLSFLQAKGWLSGDYSFLENQYYAAMANGGNVHSRVLEPLFFGTLNTALRARQPRARAFGRVPYLNGGLFSRTALERQHRSARFGDESVGSLFGELLSRYRFTPREADGDWTDAAVDPEILGRAFECLMAGDERKRSGAFYTPPALVRRAIQLAFPRALAGSNVCLEVADAAVRGADVPLHAVAPLLATARTLRVLDPACGSGAFLVHALRVLADLRVRLGGETVADARRSVLAQSIFGVDINPTAVWLCELRLWLTLAVEYDTADPLTLPPLPNLDRNIRVGDSLSGAAFSERTTTRAAVGLAELRVRYARARGHRKQTLGRELDRIERRGAVAIAEERISAIAAHRRELLGAARSYDLFGERKPSAAATAELTRLRTGLRTARVDRERLLNGAALAFSFPVQFGDVSVAGGFDAVIGNPPWVRPHKIGRAAREALRSRFVVARAVKWPSMPGDRVVSGFGAQVDLAAPFVERSIELLREGGAFALLLPSKLWCSLSGAGVRRLLVARTQLAAIDDFTLAPDIFDAATYPSLVAASRPADSTAAKKTGRVEVRVHRRGAAIAWTAPITQLALDADPGSPWMFVPPPVRRAFDRLATVGVPLARSRFGSPLLGVKTGCNDAFVVNLLRTSNGIAAVSSGEHHGTMERELLRPALRGELVRPWLAPSAREHVVWTHDGLDRPLAHLPDHARVWFRHWRDTLESRTDMRPTDKWWRLFRTPAADCRRTRVIWSDIGRRPRACVVEAGDPVVPLNSCYAVFSDPEDAWALAALLNCPLVAAWLGILAEPARGGYKRYFAWTMSLLPVPRDEARFRTCLGEVGRRARNGAQIGDAELLDAALAAYGIRKRTVEPLLEWDAV